MTLLISDPNIAAAYVLPMSPVRDEMWAELKFTEGGNTAAVRLPVAELAFLIEVCQHLIDNDPSKKWKHGAASDLRTHDK